MRRVIALAVVAAAITSCGSAVDGNGSVAPGTGLPRSSSLSQPPPGHSNGPASSDSAGPPSAPSTRSSAPVSPPAPTGTPSDSTGRGRVVTVTGTETGNTYRIAIWAHDSITDCAAHAYGTKMVNFLRAHPCGRTSRVLATLKLAGRTVALSEIDTAFPGTDADPYGNAGKFKKLELADGTGSIEDLLQEGYRAPGVGSKIPDSEAFEVLGEDTGVSIFDAWYASGHTADQDPSLVKLDRDLFLAGLTGK